jgi:hypothetical protein
MSERFMVLEGYSGLERPKGVIYKRRKERRNHPM